LLAVTYLTLLFAIVAATALLPWAAGRDRAEPIGVPLPLQAVWPPATVTTQRRTDLAVVRGLQADAVLVVEALNPEATD
jgi:hypothetical protein